MPPAIDPRRSPSIMADLAVGVVVVGLNYVAFALLSVPLLPDQLGSLFLRALPLTVFGALLHAFGPLARPLLLLAMTAIVVVGMAVIALLLDRLWPRSSPLALAILTAAGGAAVARVTSGPADTPTGAAAEVMLLALGSLLAGAARPILARPRVPDGTGRRELLRNLGLTAVALTTVGIGYFTVRRFLSALQVREGARAASEITPVGDFYVVSKNLVGDPVISTGSWKLTLPDGQRLSYEEVLSIPPKELELTLSCISNEVGGSLISNGVWMGPRVETLLARAGISASATHLLIEGADGYTESLPLTAMSPDILLATHLNGRPLTPAHGFPARLIIPGRYGMKQPKWITRLKLSDHDEPGFWERRGWDQQAIVKTMSRIDTPGDGSLLAGGVVRFSGIAFAGDRRISGVEIRWDRSGWHEADLEREFSSYSWRFWRLDAPLGAGRYLVTARARDGSGRLQSDVATATLPNGADGLHRIRIEVR